jgi:hypothetical protein
VNIHAGLVKRLPRWTKYAEASPAARAEWDQMFAKLAIHENRHVEIAVEEAEALARDLIGVEIGEIPNLVTTANQTLHTRQEQLDADSDHGARPGVPFGDVILDISVVKIGEALLQLAESAMKPSDQLTASCDAFAARVSGIVWNIRNQTSSAASMGGVYGKHAQLRRGRRSIALLFIVAIALRCSLSQPRPMPSTVYTGSSKRREISDR